MAIQGAGKTLYREHNKRITEALKSFEKGLKDGNLFTPDDFDASMEQILANYNQDAEDNDTPNAELWRERLQDRIDEKRQEFEEKFPGIFEDVEYVDDAEDDYDVEPSEDDEDNYSDTENDDGTPEEIEGGYIRIGENDYEVLNDFKKKAYRALGYVRREVILPSYDELVEYAKDIPYIMGIEVVYHGGYFEGFKVWIEYN